MIVTTVQSTVKAELNFLNILPQKTSLLACVPICLAWLMMSLADNIYLVYGSRVLTGLGNGILTSSVYVVEVVTATRRGSVVMVRGESHELGLELRHELRHELSDNNADVPGEILATHLMVSKTNSFITL